MLRRHDVLALLYQRTKVLTRSGAWNFRDGARAGPRSRPRRAEKAMNQYFHSAVSLACGIVALGLAGGMAHATDPRLTVTIDPAVLPPGYRTESNLYLTAREAHRAVTTLPGVVLIDVRTHGETLFNGIATPMHRHIPYMIPDLDHSYDATHQRYKLEPNPDFAKAVDNLLAELKLDRKATLILYCSIGERSAKATSFLARSGFANVYSLAEGFEGDPAAKAGPGWKASGLPWTQRLNAAQAYKSPSM